MPVNYQTPDAALLFPVAGVKLGVASAEIRKKDRRDLTVISLEEGASVAGIFTQNRFCAAPVQVCRAHLADSEEIRALVINTGVANAGTGETGLAAANDSCAALADLLKVSPLQILPFSTGVILEPLPVDRLIKGLPAAIANLKEDNWHNAAHAIMTTDTVAKAASKRVDCGGTIVTISGMSKGAGMIRPNMATLLGFIATDAGICPQLLNKLIKEIADESFNAITVDGDTSTNDSFIMIASGKADVQFVDGKEPEFAAFRAALLGVAKELAQAIIRDAEGATKFITISVEGGRTQEECKKVGYCIGHSPLVKTAFFASDPNLGRILAAIGYAEIDALKSESVRVWLGANNAANNEEILVAEKGGRATSYKEEDGQRIMKNAEITIRIDLARGDAKGIVYSCDFSYDYVKINADYRS